VNFLLDAQPKEASADPDGALAMPARPIASPITDNRPRPPQTAEPPGAPQPTPPNQSPVAPPSSLGDTIDSILQTLGRILSERGLAHASDLNLTESTQLIDELGLDSLSLVDLITAVENEFAITLNFDDMKVEVLNSAGEFASLIQLKIKETARVSSGSS
jgi:acyl carrier protein